MKPEDPEEKARRESAVSFMLATEMASDYFDPHLDESYEEMYADAHEDDPMVDDDPYDFDRFDQVRDQYGRWGALKPSQGVVRILGRDEIKLGMTCDVEYGHARQAIEVEIVATHPSDKRLVTVERTDDKKWEHHKTHTRIMKP